MTVLPIAKKIYIYFKSLFKDNKKQIKILNKLSKTLFTTVFSNTFTTRNPCYDQSSSSSVILTVRNPGALLDKPVIMVFYRNSGNL